MRNRIVELPALREPIRPSPGFAKKNLADYKLDIMALCGFGCRYCSSNEGNYLRINRAKFAAITRQQLGTRVLPSEDPSLMFLWPDVIARLTEQISRRRNDRWGAGQTLVFSMLTDGFSPEAVRRGFTEQALRLLLQKTAFRIRILTKNAAIGAKKWVRFFGEHKDRFVVGLSVGTLDKQWARRIEVGTPPPEARLRALRNLQEGGIPTYGMLCPIFPDVLESDALERLVDAIRPDVVEHVWAEPFNDRQNWRVVRSGYPEGSYGYSWFTAVYEERRKDRWSAYATDLYLRLRSKAEREGWLTKLRYLLYEHDVTESDAPKYTDLQGILLQSTPKEDGSSQNAHIASQQDQISSTICVPFQPRIQFTRPIERQRLRVVQ